MAILIYSSDGIINRGTTLSLKEDLSIRLWRPSLLSFTPPLLNLKYFYWWVAHYFGIFQNKDYSAVVVSENKVVVGLIVMTPTYSRWKFMYSNDLQITNVFVHPKYRGLEIAHYMIRFSFEVLNSKNRFFWYITSDENLPSIKLCTKAGFQFVGKGIKTNQCGIKGFSKISLLSDNKS